MVVRIWGLVWDERDRKIEMRLFVYARMDPKEEVKEEAVDI